MRAKREERGLSQETVAECLGITKSQLSKWERRERRIDIAEARRYCQAIGLELVDLIAEWEQALLTESTPVEVPRHPPA